MTTYKKLLGLEEDKKGNKVTSHYSDEEKKKMEKLLDRAWRVRDFEVELFWKRTAYFSALVGALFVGFYNIKSGDNEHHLKTFFYQILLASLGCISSFIWWLSNRGSKFWQNNWEKHIDLLENATKSGDIYQLVLGKRDNAFSVSQLCTVFSFITLIAWVFLIFGIIISSFLKNEMYKSLIKDNIALMSIIFVIFLVIILFMIFCRCKTDFSEVAIESDNKEIEGSKIDCRDIKYLKRKI